MSEPRLVYVIQNTPGFTPDLFGPFETDKEAMDFAAQFQTDGSVDKTEWIVTAASPGFTI